MTVHTRPTADGPVLLSANELQGYALEAGDGTIGKATSFLFDDREWSVRYMLAKTGTWFGKEVLLSPSAIEASDWRARNIQVALTKAQIENSPEIDADKPVSRRHEELLARHYAWPVYWGRSAPATSAVETAEKAESLDQCHLRSTKEIMGYRIQALDAEIGHVEDFILDTSDWKIRWIVVDTKNWLPGRKVLVATSWISKIDWAERRVFVDLERDSVEKAPTFDAAAPVNRQYEQQLYDFYGRPKYWE